jgi:fibro-slime domain-containing protein
VYSGGERFSFTGDDDLWVFINGRLAIDLGGLHPPAGNMLDLDTAANELGIVPGGQYSLDLFHAERHTEASNFRVDTTLAFTSCGVIAPD